jgi:hypothetical protein
MASSRTIEIVQCLNCNSIVPKRLYCRKCGKVLLDATTKTLSESSIKKEKFSPNEEQVLNADTKSSLNFTHKSAYEQLKIIRNEIKGIEDNSSNDINITSQVDQELLEQNDEIETSCIEDNITPQRYEIVEKSVNNGLVNEPDGYTPDLYVKEIVEKMAKSVKYEVNLVQLLQEGQITEEIFTRLFNGLADETHGLISRREQSLNELVSLMKGYESTVLSAQQGMKLLDLRKSIGDASEEEFVVKSSALNWDIKNYGNKKLNGHKKSDYLKYIGKLIPEEELKKLENMANQYSEDANSINVSVATRERIMTTMQEVASILREAFSKSSIQYY